MAEVLDDFIGEGDAEAAAFPAAHRHDRVRLAHERREVAAAFADPECAKHAEDLLEESAFGLLCFNCLPSFFFLLIQLSLLLFACVLISSYFLYSFIKSQGLLLFVLYCVFVLFCFRYIVCDFLSCLLLSITFCYLPLVSNL